MKENNWKKFICSTSVCTVDWYNFAGLVAAGDCCCSRAAARTPRLLQFVHVSLLVFRRVPNALSRSPGRAWDFSVPHKTSVTYRNLNYRYGTTSRRRHNRGMVTWNFLFTERIFLRFICLGTWCVLYSLSIFHGTIKHSLFTFILFSQSRIGGENTGSKGWSRQRVDPFWREMKFFTILLHVYTTPRRLDTC